MKLHKMAKKAPFYPLVRSPLQVTSTILESPKHVVFIGKTTCFSRKNKLFFRFKHSKNKLNISRLERNFETSSTYFTQFV